MVVRKENTVSEKQNTKRKRGKGTDLIAVKKKARSKKKSFSTGLIYISAIYSCH